MRIDQEINKFDNECIILNKSSSEPIIKKEKNINYMKEYYKKYYIENKKTILMNHKLWVEKNIEKYKISRREYYQNNKEIILRKNRIRREKNIIE